MTRHIKTWQDRLGNSAHIKSGGAVGEAMQAEIDELRAALAQPASEPAAVSGCVWTMDSDIGNTYATSCGQLWTLMDGSPEENRVKFCHNCGLPVLPAAQTGEPG